MSTSEIHSSPAAQWLQGLLAKGAPSQVGNHANAGSTELPRDSSRISAQAFQLNQAAGTSLNAHARSAQSSGVSAAPHHRQYSIGRESSDPSFVNSVAQAGDSHRQRDTVGTPADSNNIGPHDDHNGSFIQERASKIAHDLRVAYSHVTAPEAEPAPNRDGRPISITA